MILQRHGAHLLDGLDVRAIWNELRQHVLPTTFVEPESLDCVMGLDARMLLVTETFQRTGSFKFRPAMAAALHSPAAHLLTASSGNFGAALALAARRAGKTCTVVMPDRSAAVKIEAVKRHGARVALVDTDRVTRAGRLAELLGEQADGEAVSPYDDARVIAGDASLAAELFARETPDCVVVPVGGGGLSSGFVLARDLLGVCCPIVGAEPVLANDAARSLREGRLCANETEPATCCDGARTLSLGRRNFVLLRQGLAELIEVQEVTVGRAMRLLFEHAHLVAEPTGALALAAVLERPERFRGLRVACVVSGGNVDPEVFRQLVF